MESLNLKTGEIKFTKRRKGGWLGLFIGLVAIIITAGLFWFLFLTNKNLLEEKKQLEEDIAFQEKNFSQDEFWEVYDFESRLQILGTFLKDKSSPTNALATISKNTLNETIFRGLKLDFDRGNISYECKITVPNYSFLAKQVKAYRQMENVLKVDFESGTVVENGVDSTLKILIMKPAEGISVNIKDSNLDLNK